MPTLILASGNPGKLKEFSLYFDQFPKTGGSDSGDRWELQPKPEDLELEETGSTFAENAQQKAQQVSLATGQWAIADDSGLSVDALGGIPGVFSARYAPTDPERIERLLRELAEIEDQNQTTGDPTDLSGRSARFTAVIALSNPQGQIVALAEGICEGQILRSPRGTGGFGYDPIFYVPEIGLTFAEMTLSQKQTLGHRGKALRALQAQLLNWDARD